jgi:hypothetical protein
VLLCLLLLLLLCLLLCLILCLSAPVSASVFAPVSASANVPVSASVSAPVSAHVSTSAAPVFAPVCSLLTARGEETRRTRPVERDDRVRLRERGKHPSSFPLLHHSFASHCPLSHCPLLMTNHVFLLLSNAIHASLLLPSAPHCCPTLSFASHCPRLSTARFQMLSTPLLCPSLLNTTARYSRLPTASYSRLPSTGLRLSLPMACYSFPMLAMPPLCPLLLLTAAQPWPSLLTAPQYTRNPYRLTGSSVLTEAAEQPSAQLYCSWSNEEGESKG